LDARVPDTASVSAPDPREEKLTRYLKIMGLLLATVLSLVALATTRAGAVEEETSSAYYLAESVGSGETAKVDGEQIGTATTLTVGSQPPLECSSIKYTGTATDSGPATEEPLTITPEFSTCHVSFGGTKTATVTMNGCTLKIAPTATITESEVRHYLGDTDIACPEGKAIEVHIFNTSNSSDEKASTLCTYSVSAQENLSEITFTNDANTPSSADDVVADFNIGSIEVVRTSGSSLLCGATEQTATYEGEATLRATNAASEYVDAALENGKRFSFGSKSPTVVGEGTVYLATEKKALSCGSVQYEAAPNRSGVGTLLVKPSYSACGFGTLDAHVKFQGCEYENTILENFHAGPPRITTATLAIVCPKGNAIAVEVTDANKKVTCTLTIGAQKNPGGSVELMNGTALEPEDFSKNVLIWENKITGIEYEVKGDPDTCGKNQTLKDGTLEGAFTVRAFDHEANEVGIRVMGIFKHVVP
jgi:hypothetical protein